MLRDGEIAFEGTPTSCARRRDPYLKSVPVVRRRSRGLHAAHTFPCLVRAEDRHRRRRRRAALAVLIAFMVGGAGGFSWQRYDLKTKFPNVQGLKGGAVVRVAGVEVGKVSEVEFVGAEVEVGWRCPRTCSDKITEQSRASIGSLSLLGEPVIDINAVDARHAAPGRGLHPVGDARRASSPTSPRGDRGLDEVTKLLQGHPRRQGHGREAVHRRPALQGDHRPS